MMDDYFNLFAIKHLYDLHQLWTISLVDFCQQQSIQVAGTSMCRHLDWLDPFHFRVNSCPHPLFSINQNR